MAIFGKKKDKADKPNTTDSSSGGATSPPPSGVRGGSREVTPGTQSSLNGHGNNGSISGQSSMIPPGSVNSSNGSGWVPASAGSSQLRQPGTTGGMAGAGAGFRFGGPGGNGQPSGIPQPGSVRSRTVSHEAPLGAHGGGAGGLSGMGPGGGNGIVPSMSNQGMGQGPVGPGSMMTNGPPQGQSPQQHQQLGGGTGIAPPTNGPAVAPRQSGVRSSGDRPRQQVVYYPWSQRTLTMRPPRFLDENKQIPPGSLSPSPFPRYGHAGNQAASPSGEIFLFGGLVAERVKNDLYILQVGDPNGTAPAKPSAAAPTGAGLYGTVVQTTGEIPPPRVGHATVLVSNVLILWGGDTKILKEDKQDEGLYLLNLGSREWTRVKPEEPEAGPVGRYGHIVAIVGSRFFVFGGQVDGTFLGDLWAFDLNSLKATPTWELMKTTGDVPPRRTGHASVTYKEKIYIFGGTDGRYHYNDIWCYDVAENSWKELGCIGHIPDPREGHAVCLVDDIMYIFGGRGVDGGDLGDLASFKISNQRWYKFTNMGAAPSGRSGHILSTYQNKVFVLGGESFGGGRSDDPAIVSVLDTAKIKYPGPAAEGRKASLQGSAGQGGQPASPPSNPNATRAMSPSTNTEVNDRSASPTSRVLQPSAAPNGLVGRLQQAENVNASVPPGAKGPLQQNAAASPVRTSSPQQRILKEPRGPPPQQGTTPASTAPTNQMAASRSVSSPQPQSQNQNQGIGGQAPSYTGPRGQRSIENMRSVSGGAASPTINSGVTHQRSINGILERTASPTGPTPQDGFHYNTLGSGAFNSPVNTNSPNIQRSEYEAMKKRNAWMKAAIMLAYKKGFVAPDELELSDGVSGTSSKNASLDLSGIESGPEGSDKDRVLRTLVSLKAQLSSAKATIAQQSQNESERVAEAERGRLAALQEAAFFRAKLHALERGDVGEAAALDRERAATSEKQLSEVLRESAELERQIQSLREDIKLEQNLRQSAEERLSETAKRAMAAEGAQMRAYDELATLQKRTYGHESQLREHQEQVAQLNVLVAEHQSNHEIVRSQLEEANETLRTHSAALPGLQAALAAAAARATEHERLHFQHRDVASQHQETINRLRSALESKTAEADTASKRIADLEALLNTHKTEAETHRVALAGGLSQLLTLHQQRSTRAAPEVVPDHATERIQALEAEADTLRQLQNQSRAATDAATSAMQDLRDRNLALEKQHSGLRTELSAMRGQLAIALQEVTRLKDQSSAKDLELRDRSRALEAAQLRDNLLRRYIADRGAGIPADEELSAKGNFADKRIRELEAEVDARTKSAEEAEHRLREAATRVEELQRAVEHGSSTGGGVAASGQSEELERRVEDAERELAETNASYKERMAQLEKDYQTAVSFVKGTEKMLRRMKDELSKYKAENTALQSELASARTGDGPMGESEAAKDIEALRTRLVDITQQAEETAAENRALEKKLASLITDQKDLHDRSRLREDSQADSHSRRAAELEGEVARLRKEVQEMLQLNQHLSSELKQQSSNIISGPGSSPSSTSRVGLGGSTNSSDLATISNQNDQLRNENEGLARRLEETEGKLSMLLGNFESSIGDDGSRHGVGLTGSGSPGGATGISGPHGMKDGSAIDQHSKGIGGGGGGGGGATAGSTPGDRYSLSSELDKWERERTLGDAEPYSTT